MRSFGVIVLVLGSGTALASRVPPVEHALGIRVDGQKPVPLLPALPSAPAQNRAEAPEPDPTKFTGRRVDLDFRHADVRRILRILAGIGQVGIVPSDDVSGEVTIKMRDAPWELALHAVARVAKLSYDRNGNVIRVWKKSR
jgi:type II secretory pathway component HofQ